MRSLSAVRARIGRAAQAAGRDQDEIVLVAVTKTFPAEDVIVLAELGVTDVGENRDQEAKPKVAEVEQRLTSGRLRWHFVGQLQTNKARSVVRYADVVHSLDRPSLVTALGNAADAADPLEVFLQVDLGTAAGRGGAAPGDVPALAQAVLARPELTLRGVMAVAPLGADPEPAFARLAEVSADVRQLAPEASAISAGMSGDLEAAVRHGATHVRIGSALLGHRPPGVG